MDSNLPLLVLIIFILTFTGVANATTFYITNNCPHTVWAAAVPGGGTRLQSGETWILDVDDTTTTSRIWGRTGCQFDADGKGKCRTGDCNGLLKCQDYGNGSSTLAEYSLDQYGNMDFFDVSLVDGYNVGMEFSAAPGGKCTALIRCEGNIVGECPYGLVVPGGCNGPCPTFNTEEYCCTSGGPCGPTTYSRFFKERCPAAYSYPLDDASSVFTCPAGTDYRVTFCP